MGDPDSSTHIVQDRVADSDVHVLTLSDEEDPTSRPPASPTVGPRPRQPIFHAALYSEVSNGLAQHPWNVFPGSLARCIDSVFAIQQSRYPQTKPQQPLHTATHYTRTPSTEERTLIRRLVVDLLPSTIEKCMQEPYVRQWSANIQRDIMSMAIATISLAKMRLQEAALQPLTVGTAEELLALMQSLAVVMEPTCTFHLMHRL